MRFLGLVARASPGKYGSPHAQRHATGGRDREKTRVAAKNMHCSHAGDGIPDQDLTFSPTIDVHSHILPEATIRRLREEAPRLAPKLIEQDGTIILEIAGKVLQRPMPREGFDLDLRLRDMDQHGVAMQLIAATVHTFFYDLCHDRLLVYRVVRTALVPSLPH